MGSEKEEIKIVGVDKEAIKVSPDKQDFWTIHFKLSCTPEQSWERKFSEVHQKDSNALKRKTQVIKDFIKVEVSEKDDLQKILDTIKLEIVQTNVLCEEDFQKKLKLRQELDALQQKQSNATQKFKDDSDKLNF